MFTYNFFYIFRSFASIPSYRECEWARDEEMNKRETKTFCFFFIFSPFFFWLIDISWISFKTLPFLWLWACDWDGVQRRVQDIVIFLVGNNIENIVIRIVVDVAAAAAAVAVAVCRYFRRRRRLRRQQSSFAISYSFVCARRKCLWW